MWQLPEKWVSEDFNTFEETEVSNITAKLVTEKLERANKKGEGEEDSDDDDLNGWCYRKY